MTSQTVPISKKVLWTGYIMSALPILLFVFSAIMKLMKPAPVVEGFVHSGIPEALIVKLGILELACTIIYAIPSTAVLGAILLTGYLGGAAAITWRVGGSVVMPVVVGVFVWGGLFLRDQRLRALFPLRR
jgi:DoxX-like family